MEKENILKRLENIVGKERVLSKPDVITSYGEDMTEAEPHAPDFVVKPKTVDEIQKIVRLANEEKISITPVVAGTNLGGLAIPVQGGIVLDLKEMNRIVEINQNEMYAVVEPGVTFGQLKEYLVQNKINLTIGYPLSPPYVSIVANCLLDGLGNLSLTHGSMGEWIGSLEAVLPDGGLIKTGSAALSNVWFSRAPLPDLTGLFVNWQGTTGVVTKMSIQLWPNPPLRRRTFILTYSVEGGFNLMRDFSRTRIFDDIGGLTWPTGKMLMGIEKPMKRDDEEPEFFVYLDYSGNIKEEMNAKDKIVNSLLKQYKIKGVEFEGPIEVEDLLKVNATFAKFAEFPMTLDFLIETTGGGLTWVGTYGPTAAWEKGLREGEKIMKAANFPPIAVTRPMKGGHYGVLRFIMIFNKKAPEDRKIVAEVNSKLCDMVLDLGFIPYKAPAWAVKKFIKRIDPNYLRVMREIKKMFDPNGIMNPGRWFL